MNFPADHSQCAAELRQQMAALGCDATVSTLPPMMSEPCPEHGTEVPE